MPKIHSHINKFKFFRKNGIEVPDSNRFRNLVDNPIVRYSHMYRSSIPRNELPEDIYNFIVEDIERRLYQESGNVLGRIQHEIISQDELGFTLRSELFF